MGERNRRVSLQKIREQNGLLTLGLYALNPKTQRSPWVAIDDDYENALGDLLKLQWEVRQDGVEQRSKSLGITISHLSEAPLRQAKNDFVRGIVSMVFRPTLTCRANESLEN